MRGTDCTNAQLDAAHRFIATHPLRGAQLPLDQPVTLAYGELVRIVAWYGALRYVAAREGNGGTLENPADVIAANITIEDNPTP